MHRSYDSYTGFVKLITYTKEGRLDRIPSLSSLLISDTRNMVVSKKFVYFQSLNIGFKNLYFIAAIRDSYIFRMLKIVKIMILHV